MKYLMIAILTIGGFACGATWDKKAYTAIRVVFEVADLTHTLGASTIQKQCIDKAQKCRAAGDEKCAPAEACLKKRRTFDASVKALLRACKLASDSVGHIAATMKELGVKP